MSFTSLGPAGHEFSVIGTGFLHYGGVPFFSFQFIFLLTGPPRLAIAILRASLL